MISKNKIPVKNPAYTVGQGDNAEKQMSHYLLRAFGDLKDVFVFNDLRIKRNGEFAHIDHLVLHPYGVFIIDSKSIHGEINVNYCNEFSRGRIGMQSPVAKAKWQGDLLRSLLHDNRLSLRMEFQGGFNQCPIGVCVAISDGATVNKGGGHDDVPELLQADAVCSFITDEVERHKKARKLLRREDGKYGLYSLLPAEQESIRDFLLQSHFGEEADENTTHICSACGTSDLRVQYAEAYYFKCGACEGDTVIEIPCPSCGNTMSTKKRKNKFSSVCSACTFERVFFENKF